MRRPRSARPQATLAAHLDALDPHPGLADEVRVTRLEQRVAALEDAVRLFTSTRHSALPKDKD